MVCKFCLQAVMPAMSAKPPSIYPHVYVSNWFGIGPLTFLDIHTIFHNIALYVLMIVLAFQIMPQQTLKRTIHIQWEQSTLNHQLYCVNLKFPFKCIHCFVFVQSALCYTLSVQLCTLCKSKLQVTRIFKTCQSVFYFQKFVSYQPLFRPFIKSTFTSSFQKLEKLFL